MWNPSAITLANSSTLGLTPYSLFVSIDDIIYVPATNLNEVLLWQENSLALFGQISDNLKSPTGIFVTFNGDIYVDNGLNYSRVDRRMPNGSFNGVAMDNNGTCYGVFVDFYDDLYCSTDTGHQVVRRSFNGSAMVLNVIAGTGTSGFSATKLFHPRGIFVDLNLTLFVADCGNDRIQSFMFGQVTGYTLIGNGSNGTIALNCPSGIAFDADGYLFIVDTYNHRVLGSGPDGFRCIVGCSLVSGSTSDQLSGPRTFSFDSYGNILVLDKGNSRLQKFFLTNNFCGKLQNLEDEKRRLEFFRCDNHR